MAKAKKTGKVDRSLAQQSVYKRTVLSSSLPQRLQTPDGKYHGDVSYDAMKAIEGFTLDSYIPRSTEEKKVLDSFRNHKSYTIPIGDLQSNDNNRLVFQPTYNLYKEKFGNPVEPLIKDEKVNYNVYIATLSGKLDSYQPKNDEEKRSIETIKSKALIPITLPDGTKSDGVSYDMYSSFVNNKAIEYTPKNIVEANVLNKYKNLFEVPLSIDKGGKQKSFGNVRYSVVEALSNGTITMEWKDNKINWLAPTSLELTKSEIKAIANYCKHLEEEAKKEREPEGDLEGIVNTVGYSVENVLAGAVQGVEDASDWTWGNLLKGLSKVTWGDWSKSLEETSESILTDKDDEDLGADWKKSIEQRYEVPDWVREHVGSAAFGFGQLVPALAIEYFTAGTAPSGEMALARTATSGLKGATRLSNAQKVLSNLAKPRASEIYTFASAAGGATKAAYRESGDIDASINYGVLNGLGEIATERLFGGLAGTGIGADEVFDVSKMKGLSKIAKTKFGNKALDIGLEGVEEAIMSAADPFFQKITYNPKAEYSWDTVKNMGESAFQGMLLSSLANASTFSISKGANATQRVKAVKILNANTDAINSMLKDGVEKFAPLKYTASIEQIQQRQQEVRMFSEGYADTAIFDAIKNNPKLQKKFDVNKVLEKYNFKGSEISVGDTFRDNSTDNTFTVVSRNDTTTTVEIQTPKGTVTREFNNKHLNNSLAIGQTVRIASGKATTPTTATTTETPTVETTPTTTETTSVVENEVVVDKVAQSLYNVLTGEKLTSNQIDKIIDNQSAKDAFTRLTGVNLEGSKAEQRAIIRNWQNDSSNVEKLKLKNAGLTDAHAKVNALLENPNSANIRTILRSEALTKAFEELTGITLSGDMDARRATIREYAELAREKFAEQMVNGENAYTSVATHETTAESTAEAENDTVAEETDEDGKEIAVYEDEPTEAEIRAVVDAMNDTLKEGAEEKLLSIIDKYNENREVPLERNLNTFAKTLISFYRGKGEGRLGHMAKFFTDNGKKVIAAIEGKTDTTTTEDTSKVESKPKSAESKVATKEEPNNAETDVFHAPDDLTEETVDSRKVETDEFHSPGDLAEESVAESTTEESSAVEETKKEETPKKATKKAKATTHSLDAEFDNVLRIGSGTEGGKQRIVEFYKGNPSVATAIKFLKKEYGIGGRTYRFDKNDWENRGYVDYDAKGIKLTDRNDNSRLFAWAEVDKRIRKLIENGEYLTETSATEKSSATTKTKGEKDVSKTETTTETKKKPSTKKAVAKEETADAELSNGEILSLKHTKNVYSLFKGATRVVVGEDFISDSYVVLPLTDNSLEEVKKITNRTDINGKNMEASLDKFYRKDNDVVIQGNPKIDENFFGNRKRKMYVFKIGDKFYACQQKYIDTFNNGKNVIKANKDTKKPWNVYNENGEFVAMFFPIKLADGFSDKNFDALQSVSDVLAEKKQQKASKSNDGKLTAERVDGIIRKKRNEVAKSIVDGEKYFAAGEYWHTDLNKAELKLVTEWVRKAGKRESTRITDTANWYKGRLNGKDLFVIYSTESVDNPTILYESSGDDARLELELLIRAVEVLESETSVVEKQRDIDAIFKGNWLQEKRDMANNNAGLGVGGIDTGYASVLQGKSSEFIGSNAFRNVIKNLFGIQEEINSEAWSMPITDSMKDSVLYEGQAIYSTEEGEVNNNEQARNDLLFGNGRRGSDESSRKQAERISSFEQENQGRDAEERQSFAEELLEQGQAEEVIDGKNKYTLVKPEAYNDDMLAMVEDAASRGIELGFFLGNARIKFDTKDEFSVNGISKKGGAKLLVRYDGYTAPQKILKHETVHGKWQTDEIQAIKDTILNDLSEADKKKILSQSRYSYYKTLYKGDMDAVWEEFVADVMSGINPYIAKYIDVVSDYWYGNESAEGYSPSTYAESIDAGGVDADYLKAVESGDMETAQKMVDEAAKANGYRIAGHHGTGNRVTIFDRNKTNEANDFGQGFYFTSSEAEAQKYQSDDAFGDTYNKIYSVAYDNALERIEEIGEDANDDSLFTPIFNEEFDKELKRRQDEGVVINAYLKMDNPFVVSTSNWITEAEAIEIAKNTMYAENVPNASAISDWIYSIKSYAKQHDGKVDTNQFANNMGHAISLADALLRQGKYDGILDYSIHDKFNSTADYHAIALYPNKIKDSSPVTYDDEGKVIPLSERFNPENNDIRYALDDDGIPDLEDLYNELVRRYGAIPKGEKPARDVEVPRKISEDKVVSQHARTIMEAGVTPEEFISEFEKAILDGDMTHEVIHNKDAHKEAIDNIKTLGFQGALQDWYNKTATNRKIDEVDYAMGVELYRQCATNKDVHNAMKLAAELAVVETHAGRMLQMARLMKTLSPDGQLYYLEKSVQMMEKEFKDKLGDKFKGIKLDESLMEEFLTEKDEAKRDVVYDKICQNIADQTPATLREKWDSWRYLAMLGNPRTQIKNLSGNLSFAGAVRVKNYVAAAIEYGLEKGKKMDASERTKSLRKDAKAVEFAKEDANKKEVEVMLQGINGKYTTTGDIQDKRRIFKNKAIEGWRKVTFNGVENPRMKKLFGWYGLENVDMKFLKFHYKDALARLITARNIDIDSLNKDALDKLRRIAVKEAQTATFRDANIMAEAISNSIKWLRDNKHKSLKVAGYVLEGISPFVKTPMNIAKQGLYYSPAGLIIGTYDAIQKHRGADISTSEVVDVFARGLTGTAALTIGYILASLGILVGGDDEDKKKSSFDELVGEQSYSIKIGDHSYTIDWAVPSSMSLFVGSELYELTKDEFKAADVLNAMSRLTEPLLELSVFSGWNNAIQAANYNDASPVESVIYNALSSYVTQALPTIGGQISRIFDKKERSYYYMDKSSDVPVIFQRLIGQVASKIPFAGYLYAPTVDDWGRDEEYGGMLERVLENTVSPGYYSETNYTEVDTELKKLYEATGDSDVLPSTQSKHFTEDGETKYLSADEYAEVKRLRGQKSFELISELMEDEKTYKVQDDETDKYRKLTYSEMSDKQKVTVINRMYKNAGEYAKAKYMANVYEKAAKSGDSKEQKKLDAANKVIDKYESK